MSTTPHILISDPLHSAGVEMLQEAGAELTQLGKEEKDRLPELLPTADALIVRSGTTVTAELLEHAERLQVIGRAGIGVDNVDVQAATARGILVVNAPTANLISATEHTWALMLALARNIPAAVASVRQGEWERKRFLGRELAGKTLGVIGFGRIGQQVARRGAAFDMEVIAYDPFLDAAMAERQGVELVSLDELLPRADVVTLHTPLTAETRGLLDAERLAQMKLGALLVNCARGGVVDDEALLAALESEALGGAALDVFTVEPPESTELVNHPHVVATPHIGAQTREAQERVATDTAKMVLAALDGSLAVTAVNLPFRPAGPQAERYLELGERMGQLAGALVEDPIQGVEVELWGIDDALREPLAIAVLKGVLTRFLGEGVNYVNAEAVATERGLEVVRSTHRESSDYPHLVGVRLETESGEIELSGALIGERDPRVVRFQGYPLEFRPAGRLLVVENRDVPGVVGKLGTLLGEAQINIADIHLARRRGEEIALAVLRLDQTPTEEAMKTLRELDEVRRVRHVELDPRRNGDSE